MNIVEDLELYIKNIISLNGAIPLDQFLSIVIPYYYKKQESLGVTGDFITAPEASQMFGEVIGIWAVQQWLKLNKADIELIELGPGSGFLLADLMRATKNIDAFHHSIKKIHLVEISDRLRKKQKESLKNINIPIHWHDDLEKIPQGKNYLIIANEFLDALPIKQFIYKNEEFYEVYVGMKKDKLSLQQRKAFLKTHQQLEDAQVIEVPPALSYYTEKISNLIENKGSALIIDYGYVTPPKTNTLQAITNHKHTSILNNIGKADITSLVNFSHLIQEFEKKNIKTNLYSQSNFLKAYGVNERATQLIKNGASKSKIEWQLELLTKKMGEKFKVLEVEVYN